jgi:hypothetical protein
MVNGFRCRYVCGKLTRITAFVDWLAALFLDGTFNILAWDSRKILGGMKTGAISGNECCRAEFYLQIEFVVEVNYH